MPPVFEISIGDIKTAEAILLPSGKTFNEERVDFIKDIDTLDLQAVPGSGKTTALLAKLIALENKLPLEYGKGILVLSHTNAAVDEIKKKLSGYCPKLFSYPNFIGTIQSFADEFLAIPFYVQCYGRKPIRIDNEIFQEIADNYYRKMANTAAKQWLSKQSDPENIMRNLVFDLDGNLKYGINGGILLRKAGGSNTFKQLAGIKKSILEAGFLNYDDAYSLAFWYLQAYPGIVKILQKRFRFVFVDEMQDMDTHQNTLLEQIFHPDANSESIVQRIGDKNQAIYNSVKSADVWEDRATIRRLSDSLRLSPPISKVVQPFAIHKGENYTVNGVNNSTLKPHILVYTNETLTQVIPYFSKLVSDYSDDGALPNFKRYPIKAIAWNTEWIKQAEIDDIDKIRLVDYFPGFSKNKSKVKNDYGNLQNYLLYYDKQTPTLESVRKQILNALLKVLRLEQIYYNTDKHFGKRKLLDFLKESYPVPYEELKLNLYNWSIGMIREQTATVLTSIKEYIPVLLALFGITEIHHSRNFIFGVEEVEQEITEEDAVQNIYSREGFPIEVTSVHSVKGQTHCATLYLESYYYKDGTGANSKSYESQRLSGQFLGTELNETTAGERIKQSAKMTYVGFSRPTDLLCVAVHKTRFDALLFTINRDDWDVLEVSVPFTAAGT
jgi:DNA helicase II / ATP-dependent DNA helicase PcrA